MSPIRSKQRARISSPIRRRDYATSPPRKKLQRKRLERACVNCHKDKRKCDGTGPCSTCYYGGKSCVYKNKHGMLMPPPVGPDESQQAIIDAVDLTKREHALLTYRTVPSAADLLKLTCSTHSSDLGFESSQLSAIEMYTSQATHSEAYPTYSYCNPGRSLNSTPSSETLSDGNIELAL